MATDGGFYILPYYHPTTANMIDDEVEYVDDLSFAMEGNVFCHTFRRPEDALEHINTPQQHAPRRWLAASRLPMAGRHRRRCNLLPAHCSMSFRTIVGSRRSPPSSPMSLNDYDDSLQRLYKRCTPQSTTRPAGFLRRM